MRKTILFSIIAFSLITMVLVSTSCTKNATPPTPVPEDLTVVIGSVSAKGDTTVYLQTVVRPAK